MPNDKRKMITKAFGGLPLDGEEDEIINDETCFVQAREPIAIDIISRLPIEIALKIIRCLDLPSIITCLLVSRYWNALASDNSIWKVFFDNRGWDAALAMKQLQQDTHALRPGTEIDSLSPVSPGAARADTFHAY